MKSIQTFVEFGMYLKTNILGIFSLLLSKDKARILGIKVAWV